MSRIFNLDIIATRDVGFDNVGGVIRSNLMNVSVCNIPSGFTTYQWVVKADPTDADNVALAGNFGALSGAIVNHTINLVVGTFTVGQTYYYAIRVFNAGGDSIEVGQVSFTIAQNAVLGTGTGILNLHPLYVPRFTTTQRDAFANTLPAIIYNTTTQQYERYNTVTLAWEAWGGITDGDKGDISVTSNGGVWTIDNQAVTRNKLEHLQSGHFLARHAGGTGNVQETSSAQARTILSINNVDNTSDINKPISTVTQTALNNRVTLDTTQTITGLKGFNNNDTFFGTGQLNPNLCFMDIGNLGTANSVFFDARSINVPNVNIIMRPRGSGVVSVNNTRLIEVATPTANTDAANKAYVDNHVTLNTTQTITGNKAIAKLRTSGGNPATIASDVDIQVGDSGTTNSIAIGDSVKIRGNFGHSEETFLSSGRQKRWRRPDGTTTVSIDADDGRVNMLAFNMNNPSTPASATATGTQGDIRWDANFIYVCIATNTWKRTAISTW